MDITQLKNTLDSEIKNLKTEADCSAFHQRYLGKNGQLTTLLVGLKDLPKDDRGRIGAELNYIKREAEVRLQTAQTQIKQAAIDAKLMGDALIDITVPRVGGGKGGLHPITRIRREVEEVFSGMGFIVEDGPEIASEYENFTSLNVPEHHPARDIQDTFYLSNGMVLRPHTSAMQNTLLKKYGPTFSAVIPGRTYRNENLDATHEAAFFQVEGMMVGRDISVSNLVYFLKQALTAVLGKDIDVRLSPDYFPFTEPSFGVAVSCIFCDGGCSVCKRSGWIEFCGAGMIHPNVLKMGGVDPDMYQGFAFGFGLTRLVMLKYGIEDIRLFNSGNLDFLEEVNK